MDIELVTEGLEFPEGPIAMADGSVILTEIKGKRLTRVTPDGKRTTVADTGGGPNGAAIGPDGSIYVTNNGGAFVWLDNNGLTIPGPTPPEHTGGSIQKVDIKTGAVTTLYTECEGRRLIGPNDLVFDKQGGFWFTDHGCGTPGAASSARSITPRPTARISSAPAIISFRPTGSACRRTRAWSMWPTLSWAACGVSTSPRRANWRRPRASRQAG